MLRAFDIHASNKVSGEFVTRTSVGGLISLLLLLSCCALLVAEVSRLFCAQVSHSLTVDHSRGELLEIHINISFPSLPCGMLTMSAVDATGRETIDIHSGHISKMRVDRNGRVIGEQTYPAATSSSQQGAGLGSVQQALSNMFNFISVSGRGGGDERMPICQRKIESIACVWHNREHRIHDTVQSRFARKKKGFFGLWNSVYP